jgi:hypothetical protein
MFWISEVTKWQDGRDSSKRTHKRDIWALGYRLFALNPSRIVDLKVHGTGSCFRFSDNHRDRREGNSYIECNETVAEIIAAHDTPYHSKFVTLDFYPKNNHYKTPVPTTLDVEDIAYVDDYNDPDHPDCDCIWIVYNRKAFKRVEQLVRGTLDTFIDLVETGTTSTTTTTTELRDQQ